MNLMKLPRPVLLALFLISQLGVTVGAAEGKLPLWKVEGGNSPLYLLGSIHFLKSSDYPLAVPMETAYQNAQVVVFETDMAALESPATQIKFLTKGRLPEGGKLSDELSPEVYEKLMEHAEKAGLPGMILDALKPSMAVMMIVALEIQKMGFDPDYGVDQHFFERAQQDEKTIVPLETVDFQIGLITDFTKEEGELLVETTLEEFQTFTEEFSELVAAWKVGDTGTLDEILNEAKQGAPTIMKRFLTDRNARWVPQIEKLARGDKATTVIVGAAHLLGEKSVVELLQKKGFKVTQIAQEQ